MKILIASMEDQWEIKKIKQVAKQRGHLVKEVKPSEALIDTFKKREYDVALFRPLSGYATQGRALAAALYYKGVPLVDEKLAFEPGGNKFKNYWALKKEGLNVPKTVICNQAGIDEAGKWKGEVVLKPLGGKRGEEIYKCPAKDLPQLVRQANTKKKEFIIQEYLPVEKELRVLVVGRKVLGGFKKLSADWRHNVSRGALPVKERLSAEEKRVALKAAKATRVEIAGVDLALSKGKPYVFEVNRSPQFRGFQKAHPELNIAEEMVKYLEWKAKRKKLVYFKP